MKMRDYIYRYLPVLILLVFSINSATANQRTFTNPRVQGHIVDNCKTWATNCDGGGAQLFCQSKGYNRAVNWQHNRPGSTYVMGSKQVCRGNFCVGYSSITCRDDNVPTPPVAGKTTFKNPRVNGHIVDNCKTWATNCGGGGAQLFCQSKGYNRAVNWQHNRPGTTYVMGSKQVCRGDFCVGYSSITCSGKKVTPPPMQTTFNNPRVKGHIVDNCKTWATNCDGGGAQLFCQSKGFNKAVSWKHNRPGSTYVIGSNRVCKGNFCVGYSTITCR
jgi:uncharacterized C2H2 Zn-finger protein